MLEISLCAQHNNGGLDIDLHWQTGVEGLFAVGEVAGSHGVYRPGGSALNAGQVGSTRAANYIAKRRTDAVVDEAVFSALSEKALLEMTELAEAVRSEESNVLYYKDYVSGLMSTYAGAIRNKEKIADSLHEIDRISKEFSHLIKIDHQNQLQWVFRLRDILISIQCYMSAMLDYAEAGGKSRGSALYTDMTGNKPYAQLPDEFTFTVDDGKLDETIQLVSYHEGQCALSWRNRRPLPENNDFFEVIWKSYRETGNVD